MLSSNDLAHEMPGQHVSSSPKTDSDLPSFKRIRLVTKEDIDACYSILSSYIQHPEAAALVEELIIDPPAPSFYPFAELEDTPCSVSDDFDEEAHNSIVQFAKGLSLGAGLGNTLLQALDLNSSRAEHGEGDDQPPTKRPRVRRFCELSENSDFDCAIIILLITLCPNIVTLRLGFDSIGPPLSQFFLGNNYGELKEPFLQKLRDVQFHPVNCDDERNYNYITSMEYFQYFHRLPAVYSFSLEGFEDYQADSTFFPPKVSSPSLRKIHIGHSPMSGKMISSIMLIPRTLEEFSFSTFGLMNTDGGTSLIYPKTIAKCLLEYRSSLRVLDLDAQFSGSFSIDPESDEDDSDLEDYEVQPGEEENCVAGTREWYTLQDKKDCEPTPLWADDPANAREYPRYTIGSLRDFVTLTHLSIVSRASSTRYLTFTEY